MEVIDRAKDIPELTPKVEELLMMYLKKEVAAYTVSVKGTRCLSKASQIQEHVPGGYLVSPTTSCKGMF